MNVLPEYALIPIASLDQEHPIDVIYVPCTCAKWSLMF